MLKGFRHRPAPTAADAAGQSLKRSVQSLKQIATAVGAVAAVAYGAGYIVATMHLYWWFIYNPTLVNGRYVSVGFCFLWIAAVTLLPIYYLIPYFYPIIRQRHRIRKFSRYLFELVLSAVVLLVLSAVLIGILSAPPVFAWDTLKDIVYSGWSLFANEPLNMLVGWYGFLLATGVLLRAVVTGGLPGTRVGVLNIMWMDGLIVLLLVLATYRYAISIYPHIIPAVGGGHEVLVQLLFDGKDSDYMRTLVPVEAPAIPGSRPTRSEQVELLEQTDKTYIVLVGFDLRLMSSLNDVSGIPTEGKDLVIVAAVNNVLHFRIFDGVGKRVVDTDEKKLTERAWQIEDLRKQLKNLWPPHELTRSDKDWVITAVVSIVDHPLRKRGLEIDKSVVKGTLGDIPKP